MQRALLVTNLKARSVSPRLKTVIEHALSADLKLDVAETQARDHATELAREAASDGFDLVVSLGGDGTMNEVVNGLVGSGTALAILPGGLANVMCRTLGIPVDIVEATGMLLNSIREGNPRPINLGRIDGRYFVMSCGVGLDAATVRHTERNPAAKKRYRDWFFLYAALRLALTRYRGHPTRIHMRGVDPEEDVVSAIVSNIPRFTFFKGMPITITPGARLEGGLDAFGLRKIPVYYAPALLLSAFTGGWHVRFRHSVHHRELTSIWFSSRDGEPFPVQVDGEYIGERQSVRAELVPDGIQILS